MTTTDRVDEDNNTEEENNETNEDSDNTNHIEMVAELDDNEETTDEYRNNRPRRTNAGGGIERLQMDSNSKTYGTSREFNLLNNGASKKSNIDEQEAFMQTACNVIFTQMSTEPKLNSTHKCLQSKDSRYLDKLQ